MPSANTGSTTIPKTVQKTTLDNGLTIVTEAIDSVKSVAVGIWVQTGSRNESRERAGITHFLEHMLFKGTEKRTSYEIALSMESVGGYLNAFTSSEYTCYYARCLDSRLPDALDVLADMIQHSTFPEREIEKEKKVVIEEMKMYRDSPDDYLFEQFSEMVFRDHPLGRPILGYEDTVSSFSRQDLFDYVEERYQPWNLTVAVAGNISHQQVVDLVSDQFSSYDVLHTNDPETPINEYHTDRLQHSKAIEQTHYIMGRRGMSAVDEDRYLFLLANTVLGGGMSSRLHQNIREQYGYCYSIATFNQSYKDTGLFGVYVGTDQEYVDHVKELILEEFQQLETEAIPQKELQEAKSQLKGKLLLAQESMSSRMSRLAKSELYFDRYITLDELVREIDGVQADDVRQFANDFFKEEMFSEALLVPEMK